MQDIKYAIFDIDGTVLDSMRAWDGMAARYLRSLGITPRAELEVDMRSIGGHQLPAYFREHYGIDRTAEEIRSAINVMLREFYHKEARPKPGVTEALEALHRRGAAMCAATATDRELIEPALRHCGLLKYFGRIYTCREEGVSKHVPDIYVRATGYLGGRVSETHVFEDALYAIKTAKYAGFIVTAVYDASADEDWDEARGIANYSLKSFEDWK